MNEPGRRRCGGWGFEGVSFPPTGELLHWLRERVGPGKAFPARIERNLPLPVPRPLPSLPCALSTDADDRLAHARGQALPDILRLRAGLVRAAPNGVCRPATAGEVRRLLAACERASIRVVPFGGGTSVTGGVTVTEDDGRPVLTVDLERLNELEELDEVSRLATFGAGVTGPQLERALAAHDLTLGHFPQSWELSTLGGWVATRSSGQESLGYGRIDDMVAGLELIAPGGGLRITPGPGSAAGPDLRRFVLGSEGRFGIITSVTVRLAARPPERRVEAALLPDWEAGAAVIRTLTRERAPLSMLRLSDAPETQVAMAVGLARSRTAPLARRYLRLRGLGEEACLLLAGACGRPADARASLRYAREAVRRHRGVWLGARPGRRWLADRFRHPYLRDALLDEGFATDTLETAAPWSRLAAVRATVREAVATALAGHGEKVAVLCHLSHPYPDGASLYFTFFYRLSADPERDIAAWAAIKRAATAAIAGAGCTLSHHHGIGRFHAPWLAEEIGADGVGVLRAVAAALDPHAVLNPNVLLDPVDRLEA